MSMRRSRDTFIAGQTGIQPDARVYVPSNEISAMIDGVRSLDVGAAESLVATRLRWLDKHYVEPGTKNEMLTPRDIFHIGAFATIRTVYNSNVDLTRSLRSRMSETVERLLQNRQLLLEPPYLLSRLMDEGKLWPTIAEDSSVPLYTAAQEQDDGSPSGHKNMPDVRMEVTFPDSVMTDVIHDTLGKLTAREEAVVRLWIGIGETESSLEVIGRHLGITKARAAQLKDGAIEKLKDDPVLMATILNYRDSRHSEN